MTPRPLRRGTCYRAPEQLAGTIGLLVVSNDLANRTTREATVCPVFARRPRGPSVPACGGWVDVGYLTPRAEASLTDAVAVAAAHEMAGVEEALADLLLIPELCAVPAYAPPAGPPGDYPRWATTYYAEPPLGGQTKRWLVVSHDHFNAGSGDAICVRTTSNTSYAGPEAPLVEGGTALAVCPDVQTKAHRRFDTRSAAALPQVRVAERRKVAIGLANYLGLQRFVVVSPPA